MLKKFFSVVLMAAAILFFATGTTLAASTLKVMNVAVIMEPPIESFDKPEKVYESVEQTVNKIFKNATSFSVLPLDEAAGYVQVYREENELDAESFLKKSDLDKICKRLESDFVVYLRITGTAPKNLSESILGDPAKVILDFRIWSEEQKDFVYTKRVTKTDDYSFEKALNKGLLEVEKDSGKVRAAM